MKTAPIGHAQRRRNAGYTIIELMVVVLILSLLALLTFPLAEVTVRRDKEAALKRNLWQIRDAIDAYKRACDTGQIAHDPQVAPYPPTLEALQDGVPSASRKEALLYFLRRIPRDPFADPALPAAKTWGLRSYESSADTPQPGDTVYDVYSHSTAVGLNGVPLREW